MTTAALQSLLNRIPAMHTLFCRLTGEDYTLDTRKRTQWEWWGARFTEHDLRCVIAWINKQSWPAEWKKSAMSFNRLIQDRDNFADRLGEARSAERTRVRPTMDRNRAEVLRVTGRPDELPLAESRISAQILHSNSFFEAMRKAVEAGTAI